MMEHRCFGYVLFSYGLVVLYFYLLCFGLWFGCVVFLFIMIWLWFVIIIVPCL